MDKNTLTGIILIGAVLIGFSYLNQPTPEQQTQITSVDTAQTTAVIQHEAQKDSLLADSVVLPYQKPREEQNITLGNDKVKVTISNLGAKPINAVILGHLDQAKMPVTLFDKGDTQLNFPLRTAKNALINTSDCHFEVLSKTDSSVTMRLPLDDEAYLDYNYTLRRNDYQLDLSLSGNKLEKILPSNMSLQDIEWSVRMPQQEQSHKFEAQYSGIYYFTGGDVEDLSTNDKDEERINESMRWIAFKDKYFSSVLINNTSTFNDNLLSIVAEDEKSGYVRSCAIRSTFTFSPRESKTDFTFFFGPNDYDLLQSYDDGISEDKKLKLDHLVYLGMSVFRWINAYMIIPVVSFLKDYISSWGIIILLLTILIKVFLWPFTYKSYMSQAKMRVLKPQVDMITKKYEGKTDQDSMMKKQQETMALYTAAGASPMSGCLPMLLQMPFLIALYMYFPTSIFLRGESFLWAKDLSTYDPVISWNFNIPIISGLLGNHISLFCLLMTIVNIIYNKYMMSQSSGSDAMPGMKYMPYMMSIMFFFMFNQNASGLSYYYFVSTLITIIQYFAFRYFLNEEKLLAQLEENKKKPKKKSKWMERLEEAQRQQREMQRRQDKK